MRRYIKYRKCFLVGSSLVWEWRYDCHHCNRRGFTPHGFFLHLVNRHGLTRARACLARDVEAEVRGGCRLDRGTAAR